MLRLSRKGVDKLLAKSNFASFHSTSLILDNNHGAGAGIGNVKDRMMPTCRKAFEDLFCHTKSPKTVSIIGAPMTYGQPYVGTDGSPQLLREAGLRHMLTALGWRVNDLHDIDFEKIARDWKGENIPGARNCGIVGTSNEHLADVVESQIRAGNFTLTLGGDHSIGIGSLAGILRAQPNTGVLWIDAHADLNNPDMSDSGNMHGMPVGMLMEGVAPDHSKLPGLEWLANGPRLQPSQIVYIGLRDVDAPERAAIRNLGITAFTMYDVDRYGIGNVMEMALDHLLKDDANRPLHMSYDIDAVDPILAPATGTTVRGGLTFREAHFVAEYVAASGNLASAEIVELNPTLSDGEGAKETVELGLHIVTSMLGQSLI